MGGRIRSERRGAYWLNWGGHVFAGPGTSTDALLHEAGITAAQIPGSLAGRAMNGKLKIRGRIETYPFRIPMPLSSRIALIKAGIKVGRQVLRYASITRPSPGEDPSRRQQRIYDLLLSALAEGAAGVMAGTANVVPAELVAVYDAVSAGNLGQAREAWARVYPLIDAIMAQPFIAAVKAALAAVGFPAGKPREPVAGLDPAAVTRIGELAAGLQRVAAS